MSCKLQNYLYYSMYVAALAAIARLGFKSKSHAATILVLQHYYIKQGLPAAHIDKLAKAYVLSEELITKLLQTKTKRENAQYEATPTITLQNAVSSVEDADVFITKIEEMLLR